MGSDEALVEVFKALADPNRLRLFELLLISDRSNSELRAETGLSQNLLSHHLNVLFEADLVHAHQSIGDARRRYYSPHWDTLLTLHQWWHRHSPLTVRPFPPLRHPRRVLFLCARNADRSMIAEALAHHLAPGALIPYSAGLKAVEVVSPLALRVLAEHDIPTAMLKPQTYRALSHIPFDYVITVCDRAHEPVLPRELRQAAHLHWSLRDPADEDTDDDTAKLAAARTLYHEIELRLAFFVQRLISEEEAD